MSITAQALITLAIALIVFALAQLRNTQMRNSVRVIVHSLGYFFICVVVAMAVGAVFDSPQLIRSMFTNGASDLFWIPRFIWGGIVFGAFALCTALYYNTRD